MSTPITKIKETEVVKICLEYLRLRGIFAKRINTAGIFNYKIGKYILNPNTPKGMSDILAVVNGRAIFIECKAKNGKQSENQKWFEAEVRRAGAVYFIVRSLDELINKLEI